MAMRHIEQPIFWAPTKKMFGGWMAYKDSPSAPAPPDPQKTAAAQTVSNIETANANAALNRVNQYTPWGSLTYTRTPGAATFDQAGYDAAMKAYRDQLAQGGQGAYFANDSGESGLAKIFAQAAQPNQQGSIAPPDRSKFYTQTGPDQWSSAITLSPDQQKLLDASNKQSLGLADLAQNQMGTVSNALKNPLDFSGAPAQVNNVQGGPLRTSASYGKIQDDINMAGVPSLIGGDKLADDLNTQRDALYNQQAAYLDPQWQQRQHDIENQLTQQGVMQNSDAWNRAMDDLGRQRTFDYNQARQSAITGAGSEQSRLFGLGLAANQNAFGQALNQGQFHNAAQQQGFGQDYANAQLANAAQEQLFNQGLMNANLQNSGRQQNINELMLQRQNPLNELNAFRTGSQVTSPQFGGVPGANVANTDVMSPINNAFNAQMGAYNSQVAQNNAMTGGLFQLGAAALPVMFSDRRLKTNIRRIGTHKLGIGIYSYDYIWGEPSFGAMADEVEQVKPEAVLTHQSGYKMVNYGML